MTTSAFPVPESPIVSVICCVRNGAGHLGRQLEALDAVVAQVPFEVLVVDNGSRDGTAELVRRWIAYGDHAASATRLVDGGRRPSIPHARNVGALAAHGRILAYCDADDSVEPAWVQAISDAVDRGVVAAGVMSGCDPDGREVPLRGGRTLTAYLPYAPGCNWAISTADYLDLGGFDESLPPYGFDDVDFSWRAQEAGLEIVEVPDAVIAFSLTGGRSGILKRFRLGQGRILMAHRFPRYDPREYTVPVALGDVLQCSRGVIATTIASRRVDRRAVSSLVAAVGRLAGVLRYRGPGGFPARRLLPGPQGRGSA